MTPCRPAAQIAKIKAVADDVRGHPAIRRVAQDKLEARRSHPHLFQSSARARAADGLEPLCGRRGAELEFMDPSNWTATANGNASIFLTLRGVELRVVLFDHKKTSTWGWLIIELDDGD